MDELYGLSRVMDRIYSILFKSIPIKLLPRKKKKPEAFSFFMFKQRQNMIIARKVNLTFRLAQNK